MAVGLAQFPQRESGGHHTATPPHTAFDDAAGYSRTDDIPNGLDECVEPLWRRHRVRLDRANDSVVRWSEIRRGFNGSIITNDVISEGAHKPFDNTSNAL